MAGNTQITVELRVVPWTRIEACVSVSVQTENWSALVVMTLVLAGMTFAARGQL